MLHYSSQKGRIQGWKMASNKSRFFGFLKPETTSEVQNLGLYFFHIFDKISCRSYLISHFNRDL